MAEIEAEKAAVNKLTAAFFSNRQRMTWMPVPSPAFSGVTARTFTKIFFLFPRASGKKVSSRCRPHLTSSAAKDECQPTDSVAKF